MIILTVLQLICFIGLLVLGIHTNHQLKRCRWELFLAKLDNKQHNLELMSRITKQKETIQELRNRHAMLQ